MRSIFGIIIFAFSIPQVSSSETQFSEWMQPDEFQSFTLKILESEYPIVIEAKPLLGDGVAFRALFIEKPTKHFAYHSLFGMSDMKFKSTQTRLVSDGFILIHHQKVMLMGGYSHQATWVRNENGL